MSEVRLIDADALKKAIDKEFEKADLTDYEACSCVCEIYDKCIDNAPTVEDCSLEIARKSLELGRRIGKLEGKGERPQGEWIKWNFKTFGAMGDWEYKCSNCEKVYGGEYNFCPNCGADMKGGAK